eukprot:Partr_v1_DN28216_c1_g1_i3_m76413
MIEGLAVCLLFVVIDAAKLISETATSAKISAMYPALTLANDTNTQWHSFTPNIDMFQVHWRLLHGNNSRPVFETASGSTEIEMIFSAEFRGWMAMGVGSSNMYYQDIAILHRWLETENFVVRDYTTFNGDPILDTDLSLGMENIRTHHAEAGDKSMLAHFSKKLFTGDPHDSIIKPGWTQVTLAWNKATTDLVAHGPLHRKSFVVDFFRGEGAWGMATGSFQDAAYPPIKKRSISFVVFHSTVMSAAFLCLMPLGIYVAKFWPDPSTWLEVHQTIMSMAVSQVFAVGIATVVSGQMRVDSVHSILGIFMSCISFVTVTLGWLASRNAAFLRPYIQKFRFLHKICAQVTFTGGFVNCIVGFMYAFRGIRFNFWISSVPVTAWLVAYMAGIHLLFRYFDVGSIVTRLTDQRGKFYMKSELTPSSTLSKNKKSPGFSMKEFEERVALGRKWIIISNSIFDIEDYIDQHPGGSTVLLERIGKDVTNSFFVSKKVKGSTGHMHSKFALTKLLALEVGKISESAVGEIPAITKSSTALNYEFKELSSNTSLNDRRRKVDIVEFVEISPPSIDGTYYRLKIKSDGEWQESEPGMHFSFSIDGFNLRRPYTQLHLAKSDVQEFIIKMYHRGAFTMQLKQAIDSKRPLYVEGPIGEDKNAAALRPFVQNIPSVDYIVLISAGSGMTPMLQLLEFTLIMKSIHPKKGIVWIGCHSSMNEVEMIKAERVHFAELGEKVGLEWQEVFYISEQNLEPVSSASREIVPHRLREASDLKRLEVFTGNDKTVLTFICGSPMFSSHVAKLLDETGVSRRNIFSF